MLAVVLLSWSMFVLAVQPTSIDHLTSVTQNMMLVVVPAFDTQFFEWRNHELR